jgi:hypothetical protein
MRTRAFSANVAVAKVRDLARAQTATRGQAEVDQVEPRARRGTRFGLQIRENGGDFATSENLRFVGEPTAVGALEN